MMLPRYQLELEIPAVSIDDGIATAEATAAAAMNEIPLPDNDDSTSGEGMAVTINVTQCYIASEHSYAAKPSQDDRTVGACNSDALKFKDISLSAADPKILEDGGMLTDKRINFAQRLLKHAFPNINGLQLTLCCKTRRSQPLIVYKYYT